MTGLIEALKVAPPDLAAIVGSGGKTSLMFALAVGWTRQGARVLTTTTTKIRIPDRYQTPAVVIGENYDALKAKIRSAFDGNPQVTAARSAIPDRKLQGPPPEDIDRLFADGLADLILVEADGARGLPLKAPGPDEPVYPSKTSVIILVAGLSGLDRKLNEESVFRPDVFARLGGLAPGAKITAEAVARVAFHEEGPLRNAPPAARIAVFLNQADLVPPGKAREVATAFLAQGGKRIDRVVWGSLTRPGDGYEVMLEE